MKTKKIIIKIKTKTNNKNKIKIIMNINNNKKINKNKITKISFPKKTLLKMKLLKKFKCNKHLFQIQINLL